MKPAVGSWRHLKEWLVDRDDPRDTHRHISHLFALYPGRQISPTRTPELAAAARKALTARGDAGTGWSMACKIAHWARLLDGDHAHAMLRGQLSKRSVSGSGRGKVRYGDQLVELRLKPGQSLTLPAQRQ